jgi:hypothetical protein
MEDERGRMITQKEMVRIIVDVSLADQKGAVAGIFGQLEYLIRSGKYSHAVAKETAFVPTARIMTEYCISRGFVPQTAKKPAVMNAVAIGLQKAFAPRVKMMRTLI